MIELHQLKNFNPAIIYCFDPEDLPTSIASDFIDRHLVGARQCEDLFDGYLYAQNVVMPLFQRGNEQPVTSAELITAILNLHYYMGSSLLTMQQLPHLIGKFCDYQRTHDRQVNGSQTLVVEAMGIYAEKTLKNFYNCNPENLEEVASFLAESFADFIIIRPFLNANERVAICVLNTFLQALSLPSILLKFPGDKYDIDSDYSQAISKINTSNDGLKNLIFKQISAQLQEVFTSKEDEELFVLRMSFYEKIDQLLLKSYNVKKLLQSSDFQAFCNTSMTREIYVAQLQHLLQLAESELISCQHLNHSLGYFKLGKAQKEEVIARLEALSGIPGWRINASNVLKAWLETDHRPSEKIFNDLKSASFAEKVTLKQHSKIPTKWVIKCTAVNLVKLCNLPTFNADMLHV